MLVRKDNGRDAGEVSGAWPTVTGGDCAYHARDKKYLKPLCEMHS